MATRLTQAVVDRARQEHEPGVQVYDADVSGLRVVVGRSSASYKLVGRINDGTDRYVSVVIGRTDEVSLRTARERAKELRLALRRGDDPRTPRRSVPTLDEALDRYLASRGSELSPKTAEWYRSKVEGPLQPLRKLPVDRIDREAVRALHEKITRRRGAYCANGAMRVLKLLINDVARTHDLPPRRDRAARTRSSVPDTTGLARQIVESLDLVQRWYLETVQAGELPGQLSYKDRNAAPQGWEDGESEWADVARLGTPRIDPTSVMRELQDYVRRSGSRLVVHQTTLTPFLKEFGWQSRKSNGIVTYRPPTLEAARDAWRQRVGRRHGGGAAIDLFEDSAEEDA